MKNRRMSVGMADSKVIRSPKRFSSNIPNRRRNFSSGSSNSLSNPSDEAEELFNKYSRSRRLARTHSDASIKHKGFQDQTAPVVEPLEQSGVFESDPSLLDTQTTNRLSTSDLVELELYSSNKHRTVHTEDMTEMLLDENRRYSANRSTLNVLIKKYCHFLIESQQQNINNEDYDSLNLDQFRDFLDRTGKLSVFDASEWLLSQLIFSPEIRSAVEESFQFLNFNTQEVIFLEGQPLDYWYLVVSGAVRFYCERSGRLQILDERRAGTTIGDICHYLPDMKYPWCCCAVENDTTIMAIPIDIVKNALQNTEFYAQNIKRVLIYMKRLDHITLYYNMFSKVANQETKSQQGKREDLVAAHEGDLRDVSLEEVLRLHLDMDSVDKDFLEELKKYITVRFVKRGTLLNNPQSTLKEAYIVLKGSVRYELTDDLRRPVRPTTTIPNSLYAQNANTRRRSALSSSTSALSTPEPVQTLDRSYSTLLSTSSESSSPLNNSNKSQTPKIIQTESLPLATSDVVDQPTEQNVVCVRGTGEAIGMTTVLCGLNVNASLVTECDTWLLVIPSKAFLLMIMKRRQLIEKIVFSRVRESINRLKAFPLSFQTIRVIPGNYLFAEGEPNCSELFLVLNGRLLEEKKNNRSRYVLPGDLIGVKALMSDLPRRSSVKAIRGSELILFRLTKTELMKLMSNRLDLVQAILQPRPFSKHPTAPSGLIITLFPTFPMHLDPSLASDMKEFTDKFMSHVNVIAGGSAKCVTMAQMCAHFGLDPLTSQDVGTHLPLWYYMHDLASRFQYLVFVAQPHSSPRWTELTLYQADTLVLVDKLGVSPDPKLEIEYHETIAVVNRRHLVVLHPPAFDMFMFINPSDNRPMRRHEFVTARGVSGVHNICVDIPEDFARLARLLTNQGIGLALGGGSCRGLAHLGVIKALREEGIPIDVIGGTSAGSLVAAQYGQGLTLDTIATRFAKLFQLKAWIQDFTVPYMSLLSGKSLHQTLVSLFGSWDISNLRIPMFAVATNMTTFAQHIFKDGPLWLALRASISLPPFLPPVRTAEGIHVDGGFVNKVPVEICRQYGAKHIIGVDVSATIPFGAELPASYVDRRSGSTILAHKMFVRKKAYVSLMQIMTELGYLIDYNRNPEKGADLFIKPDIRRFGTFTTLEETPDIIEKGYVEAKRVLANLRVTNPGVYKSLTISKKMHPEHPSIRMSLLPDEYPGGSYQRVRLQKDGSVSTPSWGSRNVLVVLVWYLLYLLRHFLKKRLVVILKPLTFPIYFILRPLYKRTKQTVKELERKK